MVRKSIVSVVVLGLMLAAAVGQAGTLLPGLEVRAWSNVYIHDGPPPPIDGAMFDLLNPTPAPTASSAAGTLGYAVTPIHVEPDTTEWFPRSGVGPAQTGYRDYFAVEYRGKFLVQWDGDYQFSTTSDDGSALWIDPASPNPSYSEALVKNNYLQGMTARSDTVRLDAGYHDLIVRFNQGGGPSGLYVQWVPPGGSLQDIQGNQFFHEQVPEPSTIVLLGAGFAGLLICVWRRRTTRTPSP
jgi:hypothetical protein